MCGNDLSAQGIDLKNIKSVREQKFGGVLSQTFVIGLGTIRGASWIQIWLKYVTEKNLRKVIIVWIIIWLRKNPSMSVSKQGRIYFQSSLHVIFDILKYITFRKGVTFQTSAKGVTFQTFDIRDMWVQEWSRVHEILKKRHIYPARTPAALEIGLFSVPQKSPKNQLFKIFLERSKCFRSIPDRTLNLADAKPISNRKKANQEIRCPDLDFLFSVFVIDNWWVWKPPPPAVEWLTSHHRGLSNPFLCQTDLEDELGTRRPQVQRAVDRGREAFLAQGGGGGGWNSRSP